ncbi:MAG: peptidylprolyl isomerase [Brevundimonas sp.]|uniref:peptidylprolyl isomerase n=1 Tax=Brevundimonas sp. TaxID=1871086 RepID=UPI0025BBA6E9|nr:peptidylprolyl isomerase [Brevundimonas sp.]MBX3476602.1 peptidylprolyl isomerase [Brevundimonas sp.]
MSMATGRTAALLALSAIMTLAGSAAMARQDAAPSVRIETDAGTMVVELALDRAPVSVCNFLSYVAAGDYDGGAFFRTVVRATNTANPNPIDVIQAATPQGSDDDRRPPIRLERTRDTGLSHQAGVISMARDGPDSATSSFFIVTQDTPSLDFGGGRNPDGQGFAAFGRLTQGLDVARRIQMSPADGEEQLTPPIRILSARLVGDMPARCAA